MRELTTATNQDEWVAVFGDGQRSRALATNVWQALDLLEIGQTRWRFISGGDAVVHQGGDANAKVEVSWDGGTAKLSVRVQPRTDGTFDIVGISGAANDQLPVWAAGKLTSSVTRGVEVIRISGGDAVTDIEANAQEARREVNAVLGADASKGPLVVVSAPSQKVAADLLGSPVDGLGQVAAVAASREDREGRLPSRLVVLNPVQFAQMDARAAQIVLTHEATHVLAGGLDASAEPWVVEGFADFVALHDDTADLSVSAGQALAQTRQDPPANLPSAAEFTASAHGLGAAYELAWLAFRMLAEENGDAAVISFYRSVINGDSVDQASRAAFGMSLAKLTDEWRDYITAAGATVR